MNINDTIDYVFSKLTISEVARRCRVSGDCAQRWKYGKTVNPQPRNREELELLAKELREAK